MKKKFKSEMLSSIIDGQCETDQVQQNLLSTLAAVSGWKGVFLVGRSAVSMPVWSTMRADPMHSSEAKAAGQTLKDVSHVFSFIQLVSGWVNQMATCGFRVDGLIERGEMKIRRDTDQPTILCTHAMKHNSLSECHLRQFFFVCFFFLWSFQFLTYRSGLWIHSDHRKQKHKKGTDAPRRFPCPPSDCWDFNRDVP